MQKFCLFTKSSVVTSTSNWFVYDYCKNIIILIRNRYSLTLLPTWHKRTRQWNDIDNCVYYYEYVQAAIQHTKHENTHRKIYGEEDKKGRHTHMADERNASTGIHTSSNTWASTQYRHIHIRTHTSANRFGRHTHDTHSKRFPCGCVNETEITTCTHAHRCAAQLCTTHQYVDTAAKRYKETNKCNKKMAAIIILSLYIWI